MKKLIILLLLITAINATGQVTDNRAHLVQGLALGRHDPDLETLVLAPGDLDREARVEAELPFMATENIIMEAVKKGENRQAMHSIIRELSLEAGKKVKEGSANTLIEDIANHNKIPLTKDEILKLLNPETFIGRAKEQVDIFIKNDVLPNIEKYKHLIRKTNELKV